jgi:hypothetical protein
VPVWLLHAILLPVNLWRLWQYSSRDHDPTGEAQTKTPRSAIKRRVRKSPARLRRSAFNLSPQ